MGPGVLMYLPRFTNRCFSIPGMLTDKYSDERLTRFRRYFSAIKLPSTIYIPTPSAIKLAFVGIILNENVAERFCIPSGLHNNPLNQFKPPRFIYFPYQIIDTTLSFMTVLYHGILCAFDVMSLMRYHRRASFSIVSIRDKCST